MEKSNEQYIADLDKRLSTVEGILRIGVVDEIDESNYTARVSWSNGMRSAWLKVPQRIGAELEIESDGAHSDSEGKTITSHSHTGSTLGVWMPKIGETVVSIHRAKGEGDGWILGGYGDA